MYNMDDMGDIAYAKAKKNSSQIAAMAQQVTDNYTYSKAWTPTNYMKKLGVCIEDTLYPSEWLISASGITNRRRDTNIKLYESGSILFDCVPRVWKAITKAINYDFTNANHVGIAFYVSDQYAFDYIDIRITTDSTKVNIDNDWTKYFSTGNLYASTHIHSGWNFIRFHKTQFTNVGADTWGVFRAFRVIIGVPANRYNNFFGGFTATPVTSLTVGVGGIYVNPTRETPKILLNFDDSITSFYQNGFPYMREKGIKGTMYVCKDHITTDGVGYITEAQHDELYAAGWDLGNHSTTHGDLWYMTEAEIYNEFNTCLEYLLSNGWARGAYFAAYPKGEFNTTVMNVLKELGYKMARGRNTLYIYHLVSDLMLGYPTREITGSTTQATITGWVDTVINRGVDMSVFTHGVVASNPDAYSTTIDIFKAVIDYIVEKRDAGLIEVVTISEYYNGLSDKTITVPNIITAPA